MTTFLVIHVILSVLYLKVINGESDHIIKNVCTSLSNSFLIPLADFGGMCESNNGEYYLSMPNQYYGATVLSCNFTVNNQHCQNIEVFSIPPGVYDTYDLNNWENLFTINPGLSQLSCTNPYLQVTYSGSCEVSYGTDKLIGAHVDIGVFLAITIILFIVYFILRNWQEGTLQKCVNLDFELNRQIINIIDSISLSFTSLTLVELALYFPEVSSELRLGFIATAAIHIFLFLAKKKLHLLEIKIASRKVLWELLIGFAVVGTNISLLVVNFNGLKCCLSSSFVESTNQYGANTEVLCGSYYNVCHKNSQCRISCPLNVVTSLIIVEIILSTISFLDELAIYCEKIHVDDKADVEDLKNNPLNDPETICETKSCDINL